MEETGLKNLEAKTAFKIDVKDVSMRLEKKRKEKANEKRKK